MPSPIGHLLGGAVCYLIGQSRRRHSRVVLSATLLGSVVPDFDFLPGILLGKPSAFHHGISHSLGFALAFGAVVFLVLRRSRHGVIATRATLVATFAYVFHAVLDALSVGEGARAVPLLWPFSPRQFGINLDLFGHFHHDGLTNGIWSVVRRENVPALARELTVLGIPLLLIHLLRARAVRSRGGSFEGENK